MEWTHSIEQLLKYRSPVRVEFGVGKLAEVGTLAKELGAGDALLVTDDGLIEADHALRAVHIMTEAVVPTIVFDRFQENPTVRDAERGAAVAKRFGINFIVSLGGGSSMDCAKAINLLLTNGGKLEEYCGDASPDALAKRKPLLPMIAIPTTAGTGSEAQSFAIISDDVTHEKMAIGDRRPPQEGGLRPQVAILDPDLTRTTPPHIAAAAGIDAVSHAVETAATTARNEISLTFTQAAWRLLNGAFEYAMSNPDDDAARADMLLGAHLAGCAIECSMLGAAHACANPLTARFGITHGAAVGLMLPHVIRFNSQAGANPYAVIFDDPESLARRIESFLEALRLPRRLQDCNVSEASLPILAEMAATQWTARFNPCPIGPSECLTLYKMALA